MPSSPTSDPTAVEFGRRLASARVEADLSVRKVAKRSKLDPRDVSALEAGERCPTDQELGALANACGVSVFALLPPGYTLRVIASDATDAGHGEVRGTEALDALLREYLAMVVELRSSRVVTAPTLRHDDLVELAAMLGDTPDAIETRLVELLDGDDAPSIVAMILPSTATG
jgi:transcriptional regulator with XRE-family HTH domain